MTSTLVFDVKVNPEGVVVSYLKENGEVDAIFAKKVVLACPKFVVRHLIDDLEPERLDAIRALKYRSYLVANVLVDQPLDDIFYDLYFFDGKARPLRKSDVQVSATRQKVTDLCYGNFTQPNPRRSILTLSRAFPYDEGRSELYREGSFDRYRAEFEKQIQKDIFPLLKISSKNWVDLRMARWGHPLPVPEVGVYAQKRVDALRAPFKDRVFFAEQDNWALPCFETAYYEAKNGFLEMQKRS